MARRIEYAKLGSPEYYALVGSGWVEIHSLYVKERDGTRATFIRFEQEAEDGEEDKGSRNTGS